jgi:hypothetical protein
LCTDHQLGHLDHLHDPQTPPLGLTRKGRL